MQLLLDDAGIEYDYVQMETALPPLLFLHGALGVRGQFDALRKHFPERSQIALDFPSHGESHVTHGAINGERLARAVLALLDALQIEKVDIIGHSMGGYAALVLAHLAPARVNSIVNLGTKFYWSEEAIDKTSKELDGDQLRARSPRHYEALAALHPASGVDQTLRLTQGLITDFARWQLSEEMVRATKVPILLSAGDRDNLVPMAEIVKLFDALESKLNAVAILPSTPHPLQHLPLDCFELIVRRFWVAAVRKTLA
ncbi:alpha/beta fold hydrolase [Massilia glaciei]|nr:alpha/beta hydrolase [Massilia glaciei]